jgi:hypothetical protein
MHKSLVPPACLLVVLASLDQSADMSYRFGNTRAKKKLFTCVCALYWLEWKKDLTLRVDDQSRGLKISQQVASLVLE